VALLNSQVLASFETVARLPSAKSIIVLAWVRARKKADIGDLRHSISFEIVAKITFTHDGLAYYLTINLSESNFRLSTLTSTDQLPFRAFTLAHVLQCIGLSTGCLIQEY
jgi:hypothetical protein